MRAAFVKALIEEAKENKKIFLITGDLGFCVLEPFRELFPDRFLNIGVAEQNLITVAAGLATTGFVPFVYSISTFLTMRPFEQIRNDVCLQNLNVKMIGVGGGLAYTKAGPTHHSMEDIALMRTLPMTIVVPNDQEDVFDATRQLTNISGPAYLRIERNPEEIQIQYTKTKFKLGKGRVILEGKNIAVLVTGTKVSNALVITEMLKKDGIHPAVFSFPTIQPLDKMILSYIAANFSLVVTIEEHRINGGFGTAILEFLSEYQIRNKGRNTPKILRLGLRNDFTQISGGYETLLKYHNLTSQQAKKAILKNFNLFS